MKKITQLKYNFYLFDVEKTHSTQRAFLPITHYLLHIAYESNRSLYIKMVCQINKKKVC